MKKLQELMAKLRRDEKGATVIEYALIAALVSIAAIVAFQTLGTKVSSTMNNVSGQLPAS
ncbi:Flp family type IVb pilin [Paraperlucidibaca wandonensis]|jgi:pilus assembly protein Flp/PilA|uniref:Flp family type IVb pilin n=1 Tax=Paraperlucidibaca wandonensis TaxID=1268273 RepID=A0ABW3HHG8_9GAMM